MSYSLPLSWVADTLGNLVSFKTGKLNSNAATPNGKYPFFTCSQETFKTDTYSFDIECVLLGGNNANGIYPLKYYSGKFDAYQRTYVIQSLNTNKLKIRYLYYALQLKLDFLKSISTGAATKFLTLTILKDIGLEIPPLFIQDKIVAILSAYDDLIENNTRRIEILEEMARSLYHQWFVNFRFPGYEQVKMVDSELGLIPEGWEVTSIGNHINTQKGYAFKSSWYQEEGIKIVKVSDFTNDSIDISKLVSISEEIAGQYKKHELEANDIIIQTVGSWASNPQSVVGKIIRVPKIAAKALLNQNAVKVIPKETINQYFLFYSLRNERFKSYIIGCAQGAASQASITLDAIREFKILLPPSSLLDSLDDFVSPMWKLINNLENKNLNLRCARDYLLPKLISGEIDVENLDINTGEIAA